MKISSPRFLLLMALGAIIIARLTWIAINSMQQAPAFYRQAMMVSADDHAVYGDTFEQTMIDLSNQIRFQPSWSTEMSQAEINGWIASDLPEKFPDVLPEAVSDPRIEFNDDRINIAFRFHSQRFRGFVDISGTVFCTDKGNQIALEIGRVGSGIFPIPISYWAPKLEASLASQGIILTWTEIQGNPVALIDLPEKLTYHDGKRFSIEAVTSIDGALRVFGKTIDQSPASHHTSELNSQPSVSQN